MILVATMACKNEDWILGFSLRAALQWNDYVVVLLHSCTDRSVAIVADLLVLYPGRIVPLIEGSDVWEEMRHRQRMLDAARECGATHISVVDADEVLTANLLCPIGDVETVRGVTNHQPLIRSLISRTQPDQVLQLPWVCLARGMDRFYSAGTWYNNWVSTAFLDAPKLHWQKRGAEGYDFHHRNPMGRVLNAFRPVTQSLEIHGGGLMHFQFVNERRLRAKQAKYICDEIVRWPGRTSISELNRMYGQAVYGSDPVRIPTQPSHLKWFDGYRGLMEKYYHPDAEPWQEKAVRDIVAQRGPIAFSGADLFGVA